jgi:hypothetical protein
LKGQTVFFGETRDSAGIYLYAGKYPVEISRDIRKWIDAIPAASYENVSSWTEEDTVCFSVGDVTYEGEAFTNVVLRYCVSKGTWSVYTLEDSVTCSYLRIQTNGTRSMLIGDNDGSIHTWNSGFTDNGTLIESIARTKEFEFGSRFTKKTISRFAVYSNNPQGASIRARVDGGEWIALQGLTKPTEIVQTNLVGRYFEFEVAQANEGIEPFTLDGFEFFDIKVDDYER